MRIIFWGSSQFSLPSLEALHEEHEVVGVVTNPDKRYGRGYKKVSMTPMKFCATQNDMHCMQPKSMNDPDFLGELRKLNPDLNVIVSFGRIIPHDLIYLPKYDSINLHASLLPKYRGASPVHHALLNGDKVTGNSVQFINEKLDQGDIIAQSEVPIDETDTYPVLLDKLSLDGVELLLQALCEIENGTVKRRPQSDAKASYAGMIKKEDGRVDFLTMAANEIFNHWRAFVEWPGIFAEYKNCPHTNEKTEKELAVQFTKIAVNDKISGEAGTIIRADKSGLTVACKDQAIDLIALKPSGKKEMDYKSFMNGYRPEPGNYFC